ncbi:hypothetical protein ABS71_06515 [bacterium SCN 62-11]|nr:hypothetical protein [Candidatus Eremiobacteraeota bacterium]ODT73821.1 MAG: hypothetical protein ABS71_06515 [bacterium SCN 62-11]
MKVQAPVLQWQRQEMNKLKERHSHAFCGGPVFHGTGLSPDQVLLEGIPATGGRDFDLMEHQRQFIQVGEAKEEQSALRGSCLAAPTPAGFAGEGGWVYKLYPVGGGIDVNAALGPKKVDMAKGTLEGSIMPGETEIAFASYQPSCQIEGYYQVGSYSEAHGKYRLGKFVPNPHFAPGAWESERITVAQP